MRIAAVTGLEAEARLARNAHLEARACGGVAAQTVAAAEALLAGGAEALLSFGIAGALAPGFAAGTLLLPRDVVEEGGRRLPADAAWHARVAEKLRRRGLHHEEGSLLGRVAPAASVERKAALWRATGAVAVDLESHLVAQVAAQAGRPFLVLRAIADRAALALPPAALAGLDARGRPALGRVLAGVARRPDQIPALLRLARDTRRALVALGLALAADPL